MKNFIFFSIFFVFLFSCNKRDINTNLSEFDLKKIHLSVMEDFNIQDILSSIHNLDINRGLNERDKKNLDNLFNKNFEIASQKGLENLFEQNNVPKEILSAWELFIDSPSLTDDYYKQISFSFNFDTTTAVKLFKLVEITKLMESYYRTINTSRLGSTWKKIGCGVAIAGTILVTASAVTLGSAAAPGFGTAFGFWIAGKVVATVGVVTSCG